jgi:hypothetical protein
MSADGASIARRRQGAGFWLSALLGWAVMAIAIRGVLDHRIDTRPESLARFVIGAALLHDLVLAPLVLGVGVVVARSIPSRMRAIVQASLIVGGLLTLYAFPLVRAYGLAPHNPTSLPRNYD